uniref:DUF4201 domain-containing protein n=1 Tax=Macrostomum lignano TaxID=282301 RepID=A0A1I8IGB4_9PLAT
MYEEISEDVEKEIEQQLQLIDDASLNESLEESNDVQADPESTEPPEDADDWTTALDSQFGDYYSRLQTELDSTEAAADSAATATQPSLPPGFLDQLEAEEAAETEAELSTEAPPVPPLDLPSDATPAPSTDNVDDGLRSGRSSIMTVRQLDSSNLDKRIIEAWMETEEELIQLKTERWRLYNDLTKASHRRKWSEEEKPTLPEQPPPPTDDDDKAEKLLAEEEKKQLESYDALLAEERCRTDELRQLSESVIANRRHAAALTIQRRFRGYRIRNRIGDDIQRQLERARRKVFNEKVVRLEKERERLKALEHHRRRQEGESRLSSRASSRSSSRVSSAAPQPQQQPLAELPEEEEEATVAEDDKKPSGRGVGTYVLPDQRFPPLTEVRDPNYTPGPIGDTSSVKPTAKKVQQQQQKPTQNSDTTKKKKTGEKEKATAGDAAAGGQKRPTSARATSRRAPPLSDNNEDSAPVEN